MTVYTQIKFDDYVLVGTAVYISYTSYTREAPIRTSSGHFFLHRRVFASARILIAFEKKVLKVGATENCARAAWELQETNLSDIKQQKSRNEQSTSKSFIFRCWKKFSGDENASSWVFRTLRPWDCRNASSSAAPWHASLARQLDNGTRKAVQTESIQRITQSARDFFLVHRQLHHFCFDLLKQKAKT